MEYITSFERIGIQKGMEKGIEKGEITMLLRFLESKFKKIPQHYHQKINEADAETRLKWAKQILNSKTLEEVFKTE